MVEAMKTVAGLDVELTVEERNLLSVAYKNVIGNQEVEGGWLGDWVVGWVVGRPVDTSLVLFVFACILSFCL